MYLTGLTLRGFKSFASTTRFRFEPGITAIVGPNGSGKSNVVDALAWVMGEQGAKSLRGGNMADVIFAGSSERPALGRAQVELTIDNSDGKLPISYSEVTITRTMFRSGGSEYAINHQPVRLLDVQELLSDSGLGRQMHVIVGQGQLDAVLTATPQERRAFIDEAAGVAKHRRRKERALRKLETMDGNLVRVLDLTEEIRRSLKPLARQAKAAREAAGVQERLDYARFRLLAADLVTAGQRLDRERENLDALRRTSGTAEQQIEEGRVAESEQRDAVGRLASLAQRLQDQYRDFREISSRLSAIAELADERAAHARRVPVAISDEAVRLAKQKAEQASVEVEEQTNLAATASEEAAAAQKEKLSRSARAEQARGQLYSLQNELEKAQKAFRESEIALERANGDVAAADDVLRRSKERAEEARARLSALPAPDSEPVEQAKDSGTETALFYRSAVEGEDAARVALAEAERGERAAAEVASREYSRRDTLARSLSQAPTTSARDAAPWRNLVLEQSPAGTLSQLLQVRRGWEDAVSALLGTMSEARALDAFAPLEQIIGDFPFADQEGSAAIAGWISPASSSERQSSVPENQFEDLPGVNAALSVVSAPPEYTDALTELLRGAAVCETAEQATTALNQPGGPTVAASRDGVVFTKHSARFPGASVSSNLRLRAELKEAESACALAEQGLSDSVEMVRAARIVLNEASAQRAEALEQLRAEDARKAELASAQARAAALRHAVAQEVERAEYSVQQAESAAMAAQERAKALASTRAGQKLPLADEFLADAREALANSELELEAAREADNAARMKAHIAAERAAAASAQARAFQAQAERLESDRTHQLQREIKAKGTLEKASQVAVAAREGAQRAEAAVLTTQQEAQEVAASRYAAEQVLRETREHLNALEQARGGAREHLLQAEVAFAQMQSSYEALVEQVLERSASPTEVEEFSQGDSESADYLEPDSSEKQINDFVQAYGPHNPWLPPDTAEEDGTAFDRSIAGQVAARAERELQRLGVVNPLAVEEHAAMQSRHDFLVEQVEDLNRSKADLLELIREVDGQVKASFASAFSETADQYAAVFERLFPGGTGRLELTDPDDPLSTGIEIFARPSGKKVTRLSLLSGGERSLAALAYLIAIFLARPSPFYVMDEVEAALDDTNLSRVLSLFRDLRDESQLLVITHQKRTMEIADALYGVSMRGGVTAVVSHRMD